MDIINFKKIEKTDKKIFDKFFSANYYENAYACFTGLYMWRKLSNTRWAIDDEIIYLSAEWKNEIAMFQPICAPEKIQNSIKKIIEYFSERGEKIHLYGLEKKFVEELKKYSGAEFEIESDRNSSDYVYSAENLINLSGRKYHSKKNHVNSFYKDYPTAEYLPINDEIIPKCREELNRWYKIYVEENPDDEMVRYENDAIMEIFDDYNFFNLKGGALLVGGKIIAFTFGEKLNSDTAVIHVEKADPEIRGAFAAINQNFLSHEWGEMKYINREEDMGLEGLRKAKESYRPVKMIEKFSATIK